MRKENWKFFLGSEILSVHFKVYILMIILVILYKLGLSVTNWLEAHSKFLCVKNEGWDEE